MTSGILLRNYLEKSHLNFEDVYFTNVVKHFKFVYRNTRKLHRTPAASEIKACTPWLNAEIAVVKPKVILCLGATAAKTLISKRFHITEQRGKWIPNASYKLMATFHPSALLRIPDQVTRHQKKKLFFSDIKKVAKFLNILKHEH